MHLKFGVRSAGTVGTGQLHQRLIFHEGVSKQNSTGKGKGTESKAVVFWWVKLWTLCYFMRKIFTPFNFENPFLIIREWRFLFHLFDSICRSTSVKVWVPASIYNGITFLRKTPSPPGQGVQKNNYYQGAKKRGGTCIVTGFIRYNTWELFLSKKSWRIFGCGGLDS